MKRKTIIILIIVGVLLVLGAVAGSLFFGSKTHNTTPIRIYIPEGTSQEALVDTLQSLGILEEGLNTKIFNSQFSIQKSALAPMWWNPTPRVSLSCGVSATGSRTRYGSP